MEYFVGKLGDIAERSCKLIQAGDTEIGVFRIKGQLRAYENRCLHQGGPVCQGEVLGKLEQILGPDKTAVGERFSDDEIHIVCPWHGWEYDLENGACATDRRLKLRSFHIVLREDDVFVLV
jgi:nitrite reductase/ring-hydroxylating ferredoxin subunit